MTSTSSADRGAAAGCRGNPWPVVCFGSVVLLHNATRNLLLSATEAATYELVDITNPASPKFYENSIAQTGDMDSSAEDCSTRYRAGSGRVYGPSIVYIADLTQATLTPGSPAGTWSAPSLLGSVVLLPPVLGGTAGPGQFVGRVQRMRNEMQVRHHRGDGSLHRGFCSSWNAGRSWAISSAQSPAVSDCADREDACRTPGRHAASSLAVYRRASTDSPFFTSRSPSSLKTLRADRAGRRRGNRGPVAEPVVALVQSVMSVQFLRIDRQGPLVGFDRARRKLPLGLGARVASRVLRL